MTKIKGPRGAPDILPPASELLSEVETAARTLFDRYGYRRIDTPVFEHTEVFVRTVGEGSDIVRKEMYTFPDRSERSLTLRPEGTAPVVRAFVEHRLDGKMPLPVRLSYMGPFFRYERPQTGRERQFLQFGAEAIGSDAPVVDAEIIVLGAEFFQSLGLRVDLLLNTMGCRKDQASYAPMLKERLPTKELCKDCKERLKNNPLRVFDCKVAKCRQILRDATPIVETICDECRDHFADVQRILQSLDIAWRPAPDLVRGFDYYTRTVFEFDLPAVGARSAVAGGGRYDGLVEELGGPPMAAVGLAIGVVPTMVALEDVREAEGWKPDVYVAWLEPDAVTVAMGISRDLRAAGLRVVTADDPGKSLKSQLRSADRLGSARIVILGPDELARGVATVRDLGKKSQEEIALKDLVSKLT